MAQRDLEMILIKQLASYLETPIFIVDADGTLFFYNESAELLLGRRYDETGEMRAAEWATAWMPMDENDTPLAPEDLPLSIALSQRKPAFRRLFIQGLDRVRRGIDAFAFPLVGRQGNQLGAVVIFWEPADLRS
jgi:hypothetical protein